MLICILLYIAAQMKTFGYETPMSFFAKPDRSGEGEIPFLLTMGGSKAVPQPCFRLSQLYVVHVSDFKLVRETLSRINDRQDSCSKRSVVF